jgi:hypothetical protein
MPSQTSFAISDTWPRNAAFDFLGEVKRGLGHWYAEHHASDRDYLGPDVVVEITITPR